MSQATPLFGTSWIPRIGASPTMLLTAPGGRRKEAGGPAALRESARDSGEYDAFTDSPARDSRANPAELPVHSRDAP
jgi:hypothetical protein